MGVEMRCAAAGSGDDVSSGGSEETSDSPHTRRPEPVHSVVSFQALLLKLY